MNNKIQYIGLVLLLGGMQSVFAQNKDNKGKKEDENIGTEVVNVVKSYTPTISDAFKVKETPKLDDAETSQKENITYDIFSFPVASTFKPAKGKASAVDKEQQEKLFKNYASLGFGNYASTNAGLYVTQEFSDKSYVAGKFLHNSALGNIKNVPLNSGYADTGLDVTYGSQQDNFKWNADLGYQNQMYNWYGLPTGFGSTLPIQDYQALINSIDPKHTYNNFYLGGKIKFDEGVFDQMNLKYSHFWDGLSSAENRFYAKPGLLFNVGDNAVTTNLILDYVGGSFAQKYYDNTPDNLQYSHLNLGLNPNYKMELNDLSMNLGVNLFYSIDSQNNKNKFYFYPKVTASYKLVPELMTAYAGLEGELKQNSYRDFTLINPYLSPTLNILPTDAQYDFYAGLKGKLASFLGYNLRGSLLSERNKALFKSNNYNETLGNQNYEYGNSLAVVYENLKTVSFFGELKADFSKNIAFGINGTFNSYTRDIQPEVWNLPSVKMESFFDIDFLKKWNATARLFYVGSRKDAQYNTDLYNSIQSITTLSGYFDANVNFTYQHNERWSGFLKFNNIANQNYVAWMNFPVQRFQVLLGANYKFDF